MTLIPQMHCRKAAGLKNTDYINVDIKEKKSFGGNQEWFRSEGLLCVADYGCGWIAAADLILYMSGRDAISRKSYIDFVKNRIIRKILMLPFPFVHGIDGFSLARGVRSLLRERGMDVYVHWGTGRKNLEKKIFHMLKENIPVILSAGPLINHRDRSGGVPVYAPDHPEIPVGKICGHYVTVTGMYRLENGSFWLLISSWGTPYVMRFEEWKEYASGQFFFSYLFSNILCIERKCRK